MTLKYIVENRQLPESLAKVFIHGNESFGILSATEQKVAVLGYMYGIIDNIQLQANELPTEGMIRQVVKTFMLQILAEMNEYYIINSTNYIGTLIEYLIMKIRILRDQRVMNLYESTLPESESIDKHKSIFTENYKLAMDFDICGSE